ncbi:ATP-binding protein [Silvibacterium sp.]|uniref:hybrid sensor histidine kinase/response regulator n=1 Tax=Silvibacterium sp. TaxID=1964179 RepID=UPI0039E40181
MGSSEQSKTYSILHLEDNPLDAELTADRLHAAGLRFDVIVADSRASFESALASHTFDLILADYSLPDFDGLGALKLVRRHDPRIPFVFISGVLGEDVAVDTLLSGATDYVLKQRLDRLVPAVLRALSEYAEYKSRQLAEAELKRGEERFRKLTNSLPAMVWTSDLEGRLTYTNTVWDERVGRASYLFDRDIIHPSDILACEAEWERARLLQKPFELDCRYQLSTGEYRWHLVWAAPVESAEQDLVGWVGTCTDTEQQRHREAQFRTAEKLALTGRMASVIAHEINNPLEALTNLFFLLRGEVKATSQGETYFAQVEHELLRMSAITKLTLQWSRESGAVSLLAAADLVEETIRLFGGKLRNKHIELRTEVETDLHFLAVGGEIRQVLANLLSNAIDAVKVGGHIELHAHQFSREGQPFVAFTVKDDGIGIAADRISGLFSPFHSTKGELGNGLGLYISKEIVERHHGEVLVESQLGAGTRMRVLLPAQPSRRAMKTG